MTTTTRPRPPHFLPERFGAPRPRTSIPQRCKQGPTGCGSSDVQPRRRCCRLDGQVPFSSKISTRRRDHLGWGGAFRLRQSWQAGHSRRKRLDDRASAPGGCVVTSTVRGNLKFTDITQERDHTEGLGMGIAVARPPELRLHAYAAFSVVSNLHRRLWLAHFRCSGMYMSGSPRCRSVRRRSMPQPFV